MTDADLRALLEACPTYAALVVDAELGFRLFPGIGPPGLEAPYTVYMILAQPRHRHMGAPTALQEATVTVTHWATTPDDATALAEALLDDLDHEAGTCPYASGSLQLRRALFTEAGAAGVEDDEAGSGATFHSVRQDLRLWYRRA